MQRENDPLALNGDIPAYLDDPLHPVVTGVQLLTDLSMIALGEPESTLLDSVPAQVRSPFKMVDPEP